MTVMVDNPQLLVSSVAEISSTREVGGSLDAIYIPFRDRVEYVKELLFSLRSQNTAIYLLPSQQIDLSSVSPSADMDLRVLKADADGFRSFFDNLLTSQHKHTTVYRTSWDLPFKRSFALRHALSNSYEKVLFIDDDIRPATSSLLTTGASCLDKCAIAGCFVDEFIDTSLVGHLERRAGEGVYPFLSGSFIFLKPFEAIGFFPCIYNEDWLFMIPHVLTRSICSFGSVRQLPFDPFGDINKAAFQEFGDIVAEGLYSLILAKDYARRFDLSFWEEVILERFNVLSFLCRRLPQHRRIIAISMAANQTVLAKDCREFITNWEEDKVTWHQQLKN
jgi:hypothetical protein